jgi:hypothetical protein
LVISGCEVERSSSPVVLGLSEASVNLVVIGSLGGLANEGLVNTNPSAWDSNLAPKAD